MPVHAVIIESRIVGARPGALADRLILDGRLAGVVDGATAKDWDSPAAPDGARIADCVAEVIRATAGEASAAGTVRQASAAVSGLHSQAGVPAGSGSAATFAAVAVEHRQVWRVGDAHVAINGAQIAELPTGEALDSGEVEKAAKTQADQARGRFERSGLRWCPAESPGGMAGWMRENAARLSIHALMACTYSSLVIFGRTATEAALSSAFADRPWWAISPYSPPVPRLVRDPRCLMEPGCIDEAGPPAWAAAWESLDAGRRRRAPAW